MPTPIKTELSYSATPEQVVAMLLDATYREQLCVTQECTTHSVSIDAEASPARVTVEQTQSVRGVPKMVTKIVGEEITIHTEESWNDTQANVTLTIPGHPGQVTGTTRIVADGDTARQVVDWQVKVDMPLVGRKVEAVIADVLKTALSVEQGAGRKWLAR